MNTEQERAEFEAWYQHHHGDRDVYVLDESGEYADKQVQGAFNVWQARAALQSQPMPHEISRGLLGKIVDEVFDGAIEDASVIEDIYRVVARECALQSQVRETASAIRGDSYAGIYVWYGEANCAQRITESTAKAARNERELFNFVAVGAIDALMDHALGKAIDHARRIEGDGE